MSRHHTMDKGTIGLTQVIADLTRKGYIVLLSVYEQMPFDLVAYKDKQFFRVEVKFRTLKPGGMVEVVFRSTTTYTNGKRYCKPWDKTEIDILAIYCPDTDQCYYLNPSDFRGSVSLRMRSPKNNQKRGIHLASDYTEPVFTRAVSSIGRAGDS